MRVIITSPSLEASQNVSGMSAVTQFIVSRNTSCEYRHFPLGKGDGAARGPRWLCRTLVACLKWAGLVMGQREAMIHFNLALDRRGLMRDLPLILVARLFGRRLLVHLHGGEFLAGRGMPGWLGVLVRFTLAGCPVIVLSRLEQRMLESRLPEARMFVLPNCIDVEEAMAFERSFPENEPLKILFLGRISVSKGIDAIYEALAVLRSRGVKFRFVMAGSGPETEGYTRKCRDLLGDDFEFRGVVAGREKTELLKECNVFLLPSLFEGMPMALLESMAFGLVPVTTNVGSIPTVVADGRNGIMIRKRAPEDIVSAMERLATDPEDRKKLSRNARQYILETVRPEAYLNRLNAIYQYA